MRKLLEYIRYLHLEEIDDINNQDPRSDCLLQIFENRLNQFNKPNAKKNWETFLKNDTKYFSNDDLGINFKWLYQHLSRSIHLKFLNQNSSTNYRFSDELPNKKLCIPLDFAKKHGNWIEIFNLCKDYLNKKFYNSESVRKEVFDIEIV